MRRVIRLVLIAAVLGGILSGIITLILLSESATSQLNNRSDYERPLILNPEGR